MKTWPEVRSSRPAMACMSVDLPEPDGPMTAVNRPWWMSRVDAGERVDGGLALAVGLDRVRRHGRRSVPGAGAAGRGGFDDGHRVDLRGAGRDGHSPSFQTLAPPPAEGFRVTPVTSPNGGSPAPAVTAALVSSEHGVPGLPGRRRRRSPVLFQLRPCDDAGRRRAPGGHRAVRRPGRLHHPVGGLGPRAGEERGRPVLPAPGRRGRELRGQGRQDHRRRHRRPLRRPGRPRGRRRAGRAGRAAHAGGHLRRRHRLRRRAGAAGRRQHRRGAGRRPAGRRRLHGHGRRREHRPAPRDRGRARRGAGRPGHP